jgi:hypothetical protein
MVRRFHLLAALVDLYACFVAVLFVSQRSLLYRTSDQHTTAAEVGLTGFQDLIAQQAIGMEPLEPLCVIHVHLAAGHLKAPVLRVHCGFNGQDRQWVVENRTFRAVRPWW